VEVFKKARRVEEVEGVEGVVMGIPRGFMGMFENYKAV
jgi:hypothetical protein